MRPASTRGLSYRITEPISCLFFGSICIDKYFSSKLRILRISAFLFASTLCFHASLVDFNRYPMISGFSSALCVRHVVSFSNTIRGVNNHGKVTCLATSMSSASMTAARDAENKLESRKYELLNIIQDTQRGLVTTADQRSTIEEAMVVVEGFDAGKEIDLSKLDGTWRLQYTSAPDVLILFESAARLPFFQVGQIFQKFECQNESRGGLVRNVIKWSVPRLLEENEGATLIVSARFSCVSARNIYLKFEEISLQNINISDDLQAVIAPAILPRSFLSLQILQFIRTFKAQVPVTSPERQSVGGLYYLSYLDKNMLLGRAVGGGGVFVFTRAQALIC